tara:strand:+ start:1108 stop:1353 length:246 start_codon:yes stop_codon:yes gene_type:complete
MSNIVKVDWWNEELDIYYRKMGYPKCVWKDNEGLPYGIYYYFDIESDPLNCECYWYKTVEERDKIFLKNIENEAKYLKEEV